ncbi:DUF6249 domain-containing protein [Microbulbifer yueqingensis]|uniref:DUF6249 domain-containing protein n=1 Tax=Microbulbifer yueqingensis TaxID=658219 RepID=A0A1G8Z8R2_9GAMM|nr:DUF6249 domain-containing protein [Microbulbifer yueqingensis]SDK11373.1 hypothetical protein SAMN05216212_1516 [Microbulbifer yueqingensis]
MRARNLISTAALGLVAALAAGSAWAQETPAEAPEARTEQPPAPPEPPTREWEEEVEEKVEKQVRIIRGEDGKLRIKTRDENGQRSEVEVDLGEEFGGALSRRIYEKLEKKGILDESGLVVEEAMEGVPENIRIGISREVSRDIARDMGTRDRHRHAHHDDDDGDNFVIAVIAILSVFGTPLLIVWLVTRNSYRKKQLVMDNINRMVAEGRDIPPELLDAMQGESPSNVKDRGFTLIAVGLALFIWLTIASGVGVGSLGLIPLFIGIARFINWKMEHQEGNRAG